MKKLKSLLKREYFRTVTFSYGCIFIVLLLILIIFSIIWSSMLSKEHEKSTTQLLENISNKIDSEIITASKVAKQISLNDTVLGVVKKTI